jgi:hypothetical protein
MVSCRAALLEGLEGSLLKGSLCLRCLNDVAMLDWLHVRRAVCSRGDFAQVNSVGLID